jgi:hypothetical protein
MTELLIHIIQCYPGAALTTTTKDDMFKLTSDLCQRPGTNRGRNPQDGEATS